MDGKRRVWRKLHIAVDTNTHEIIDADLNTDGEIISNLLKQTHRSTLAGYGDCAYDTRACHATIRLNEQLCLFYQEKGEPSGGMVIHKTSQWVAEVIRLK